MYVPAPFAFPPGETNVLFDIMAAHPFAVLTVTLEGSLEAVHLPVVVDRDRGPYGTLRAHVARANPIWRAFGGGEALVVFQGAHAYVSPDWYATPGLVPTWNYVAVHAYGVPRIVEDPERVRALLADLSAASEAGLAPKPPWTLAALPQAQMGAMLNGIVAFEIPLARIEGKRKLSQNRSAEDIAGVAAALGALDGEGNRAVADLMMAARG
jgi:transcriptional regulator